MDWQKIIYIVLLIGLCFLIYRSIRHQKQWFTRESLGKSFSVMGILALILIAFVALLVYILRHS